MGRLRGICVVLLPSLRFQSKFYNSFCTDHNVDVDHFNGQVGTDKWHTVQERFSTSIFASLLQLRVGNASSASGIEQRRCDSTTSPMRLL